MYRNLYMLFWFYTFIKTNLNGDHNLHCLQAATKIFFR